MTTAAVFNDSAMHRQPGSITDASNVSSTSSHSASGGGNSSLQELQQQLKREKGQVPLTWIRVLDAGQLSTQEILSILQRAVATVPLPASGSSRTALENYMSLWLKLSTILRKLKIESSRPIFRSLASNVALVSNAYLYSSWAHVEAAHGFTDVARMILQQGIERQAVPQNQLQLALDRLMPNKASSTPSGSTTSNSTGTLSQSLTLGTTPNTSSNVVTLHTGLGKKTANAPRADKENSENRQPVAPPKSTRARTVLGERATEVFEDPLGADALALPPAGAARTEKTARRRTARSGPMRRLAGGAVRVFSQESPEKVEETDERLDRAASALSPFVPDRTTQTQTKPITPTRHQSTVSSTGDDTIEEISSGRRNRALSAPPDSPVPRTRPREERLALHLSEAEEEEAAATPPVRVTPPIVSGLRGPSPAPSSTLAPSTASAVPVSSLPVTTPMSGPRTSAPAGPTLAPPSAARPPSSTPLGFLSSSQRGPAPAPAPDVLQFTECIQVFGWDKHCIVVNGRAYIKLARVGRGGSSKVYKVLSQDGNIYAIKRVMLDEADDASRASYLEEIKLLERLRHYECVIKMVDSELCTTDNSLNIILEFAEIDLARMLQRHPGGLFQTAENYLRLYWQQMLEAVAVVHEEERIVHGDIKPHNFVSVQGKLKLIDFGIAKTLGANTTHIGRENLVGTLNYLAPETLKFSSQQQSKYGRPSDIWALGCILYQMVYGNPPFHGKHTMQTLSALSDPNLKISLPPVNGVQIPADLAQVLSRCLHRDPSKRPSIRELLQHPFLHPFQQQQQQQRLAAAASSKR